MKTFIRQKQCSGAAGEAAVAKSQAKDGRSGVSEAGVFRLISWSVVQ
ncbi:MAG: hypothetical protein ACREP2_08030 [Rhodanobacteraceae bacterium]